MPMSSPNASQRRSKARPLAAALGLLSVTAVGALLFARAHAHREWPAMTAPLALEPPAVRADRATWPASVISRSLIPQFAARTTPSTRDSIQRITRPTKRLAEKSLVFCNLRA
jgi:hypothetical protein